MTESESHDPIPEAANAVSTPDAGPPAEAPEPEPEPWTPERVTEWNAYYDLYVMFGTLLLAFVVSANKINHSAIWTQLKAGQIIAAEGRPLTSDLFSYTVEGRRWVNIPGSSRSAMPCSTRRRSTRSRRTRPTRPPRPPGPINWPRACWSA